MRVNPSVVFVLVSPVFSANATRASGKPVLAKRQTVTASNNGCTAVCKDYGPLLGGVQCDVSCGESSLTAVPTTSTSTSTRKSTRTSTRTSTVISTVTSKPKTASNQRSTVSHPKGGCHETCSVNEAEGDYDCYFTCNADFATIQAPSILTQMVVSDPVLHQRTVVSAVAEDCTAVCWDLMPGTECDIQCEGDFKTRMPGNTALS